jgi:hypothetical protein
MVFVFAADTDHPPIPVRRACSAHAVKVPDRPCRVIVFLAKIPPDSVRCVAEGDWILFRERIFAGACVLGCPHHPLPERERLSLRIRGAEPPLPLALENAATDFQMLPPWEKPGGLYQSAPSFDDTGIARSVHERKSIGSQKKSPIKAEHTKELTPSLPSLPSVPV